MTKKYHIMEFEGKWRDSYGQPERSGSWLLWAQSGNGKTAHCLQMAKYLTNFGKVAYNTAEEGARLSFKMALENADMSTVSKGRFIILDGESIEELSVRLRKKKSPDIIINDSVQYVPGLTKITFHKLIKEFPRKLFIFTSWSESKLPDGRTANAIRFHSDLKIRIEGFKASPGGRLNGGGEEFVIWEEGAQKYWDRQKIKKLNYGY